MSLAFLLCVEAGNLENQASLLVRSIRRYGGRWSGCPIVAFQPREGPALSPATTALFRELDVDHRTDVLNTELADYPLANKAFVGARAERDRDEDVVVFVDSDSVILDEPAALDLPPDVDVAVRPVDRKGQGSAGPEDANEEYWRRLYGLCGVPFPPPFVSTTVDGRRVRAYWNTGLIAVRRDAGVFTEWLRCLRTAAGANHVPRNSFFLEQMSFAPATALAGDAVRVLDHRYNYPLPLRTELPEPLRSTPLDDLVHVHYHKLFNRPGHLHLVRPRLDPASERVRWLEQFLPFRPTVTESVQERAKALRRRLGRAGTRSMRRVLGDRGVA